MNPADYIKRRQILWALRNGKTLLGSSGERGERAYVDPLVGNLYEPLTQEAEAEFNDGDGSELKDGKQRAKMRAVHSSSALGCNVFHYWKKRREPGVIAKACGFPSKNIDTIAFEQKFPIDEEVFDYSPNLDIVFRYASPSPLKVSAIESKFSEAYGSRGTPQDTGLSKQYLDHKGIWKGLSAVRNLAEGISPADKKFTCLHAAQLIKHLLGLNVVCGLGGFRLLYLWYQAPGSEGACHQAEVEQFASQVKLDGVQFSSMTYQELLLGLSKQAGREHSKYVDYVVDRYL